MVRSFKPSNIQIYIIFSITTLLLLQLSISKNTDDNGNGPPDAEPSEEDERVCKVNKDICNTQTGCRDRLIKAYAACVPGLCQPACMSAMGLLYGDAQGRKLMHSNMFCLGPVDKEAQQCGLDPKNPVMHCSLAKQRCEFDSSCAPLLDIYLMTCSANRSQQLQNGQCSEGCAEKLLNVFHSDEGEFMRDCECWIQDPPCRRDRDVNYQPCLAAAGVIEANGGGTQRVVDRGLYLAIALLKLFHFCLI